MSNSENLEPTPRRNFASRLLNKELSDRTKKTTLQLSKLKPADAAKFATSNVSGAKPVENKEAVTSSKDAR